MDRLNLSNINPDPDSMHNYSKKRKRSRDLNESQLDNQPSLKRKKSKRYSKNIEDNDMGITSDYDQIFDAQPNSEEYSFHSVKNDTSSRNFDLDFTQQSQTPSEKFTWDAFIDGVIQNISTSSCHQDVDNQEVFEPPQSKDFDDQEVFESPQSKSFDRDFDKDYKWVEGDPLYPFAQDFDKFPLEEMMEHYLKTTTHSKPNAQFIHFFSNFVVSTSRCLMGRHLTLREVAWISRSLCLEYPILKNDDEVFYRELRYVLREKNYRTNLYIKKSVTDDETSSKRRMRNVQDSLDKKRQKRQEAALSKSRNAKTPKKQIPIIRPSTQKRKQKQKEVTTNPPNSQSNENATMSSCIDGPSTTSITTSDISSFTCDRNTSDSTNSRIKEPQTQKKFNWFDVIKHILNKHPNGSMSLTKLKRKVLRKYRSHPTYATENLSEHKIDKRFGKTIKHKCTLLDNNVKLRSEYL